MSSSFRVSSYVHISHATAASFSLPLSTTHPSISTMCYPLFIVIIIVEIVTSSLDPICILSSLFWKEGKKERKKQEKKKEKKKSKKKKGEKEKKCEEKNREKKKIQNSDLSKLNLVVEFGLESVLRTVQ